MTKAPAIFRFEIDSNMQLELHVVEDPPTIRQFDWSEVWLNTLENCYCLQPKDELDSILSCIEESLGAAFEQKIEIPQSLPEDLSVLWSKYRGDLPLPQYSAYSDDNNSRFAFFCRYFLFSRWPATWIYTKDHSIHVQLAPIYNWSVAWEDDAAQLADFENWLKLYKPILEFQISYDQARQWLKTVADIRAQCQPYPSELKAAQDRAQKESQD